VLFAVSKASTLSALRRCLFGMLKRMFIINNEFLAIFLIMFGQTIQSPGFMSKNVWGVFQPWHMPQNKVSFTIMV
jgi:hypothetical protein